jgi:hypothetical protein
MAMLLFKGETLKVKVTHNVISEIIRMNDVDFMEAMNLSKKDPMGWMRDVLYSSLRVYNPDILGSMSVYGVGDELFKLSQDELGEFLSELMKDFVEINTTDKVASSEKVEK